MIFVPVLSTGIILEKLIYVSKNMAAIAKLKSNISL